jgi:hypothetical protein
MPKSEPTFTILSIPHGDLARLLVSLINQMGRLEAAV